MGLGCTRRGHPYDPSRVALRSIAGVMATVDVMGVMKPLFAHQQAVLDFLRERSAAAVFAGLGTGKTRIILEDARRRGAALVVVCPKTALLVWTSQIRLWEFEGPVYLINYERVWRSPNRDGIYQGLARWIADQRSRHPIMIVLDESQKIKDRTTKQSKVCRKIGRLTELRRILSGTPVLNGLQDLWSQFSFLIGDWPDQETWRTWKKFQTDHLVMHPIFPGKVEAVRNPGLIQRQLAPFTFHIRAEDVLDLPESTDIVRECELGATARQVYKNVERDLFAELEEADITAPTALVKILRLAEITGGFVHTLSHDNSVSTVVQVDRAKLDLLADIVEELGSEPFVVFMRFTAERRAIEALFTKVNISWRTLYGGQSDAGRAAALADFQRGEAQALVAMLQTGSASIDLSRARYSLMFSVGWSFGDWEQSRGRIRRQGQTRPQFYVSLVASDTIDEYIAKALQRKQGVSHVVQEWWRER